MAPVQHYFSLSLAPVQNLSLAPVQSYFSLSLAPVQPYLSLSPAFRARYKPVQGYRSEVSVRTAPAQTSSRDKVTAFT